ncbi:MAG TPA: N-acetylmuramoyl-L-alanine amidase [Archangium sp.]
MRSVLLLCVFALGCTERRAELHNPLTGLSPRVSLAPVPFVRVGFMMDAPSADAIELRTSLDGVTWTEWQAPTIVFAEGGAYAGHLDAPPGSLYFEHRVKDPSRAPTWLQLEDIESLGEPSAPVVEPPPTPPGRRRDALAPFPNILPRSAWNARAPTCRSLTNPYRMVVHHTASPTNDSMTPEQRLRQTQAYHMDTRGYCDIAYNFLMSRDARVWEGRGDGVLGGHTLNQNGGNMALCIIGTYTTDTLTPQQECAAAGWMAWQSSRHGITLDRNNIKGHREWGSTECPGQRVFDRLGALVQQAATTCDGLEPPRPEWAATFVGQSFIGAHEGAVKLEEGETLDGWFELRNTGTATWSPSLTRLAPTPRDQDSALADASWLSASRVGGVAASTAPNAVGRFAVRLRGNTVGTFTQTFGLVQEGVAWFADRGGPADTLITVRVEVVPRASVDAGQPEPDAGVPDAGVEPIVLDGFEDGTATLAAPMPVQGGCGCTAFDGGLSFLALMALAARRRNARSVRAWSS